MINPRLPLKCTTGALLSDEEYLAQKQRIREEADAVQRQLTADDAQGTTWIDDCERFFAFTQGLAVNFAAAAAEEKQSVLFLICSKLTLRDHTVTAQFREPFASLAAFPLAGESDQARFEPRRLRTVAEKPQIMESWLSGRVRHPLLRGYLKIVKGLDSRGVGQAGHLNETRQMRQYNRGVSRRTNYLLNMMTLVIPDA